jgi:hypothetical protein
MNFINPLKSAYNTVGNTIGKVQVQYPKTYEYLHNIGLAGQNAAMQGNPMTAMAMTAFSPVVSGVAKRFSPTTSGRINAAFSGATKLSSAIQIRAYKEIVKNASKSY